jgi:hypothetical protein
MTAIPEISDVVAPGTEPAPEAVAPAQVVITEQQVALSTAAAVLGGRTRRHRWTAATSAVAAAWRRIWLTSAPDAQTGRRHYPKNYAFIERAAMARAMERL